MSLADEWYAEWLLRVNRNPNRRSRISRERLERPNDYKIRALREYDAETENLLRFIQRGGTIHDLPARSRTWSELDLPVSAPLRVS